VPALADGAYQKRAVSIVVGEVEKEALTDFVRLLVDIDTG
jgi:hypothetical protein